MDQPQLRRVPFEADSSAVLEFFHAFSRFEFALKRARYSQQVQMRVTPDWKRFGRKLETHFDHRRTLDVERAVDYIANHPPKKQVLTNGLLDFVERGANGNRRALPSLLRSTADIRNNLFHGAKYPSGPVCGYERNTTLLNSGIAILGECLVLCKDHIPKVYTAFYEPQ